MTRYSVDCREMPSDNDRDVMVSGGEEHLIEAVAVHVVTHDGHADALELRDEVRTTMKPEADDQ